MNLTESINKCLAEKSEIHRAYDSKKVAVLAGVNLTTDVFAMLEESDEHATLRAAAAKIDDARIAALAAADARHLARISEGSAIIGCTDDFAK